MPVAVFQSAALTAMDLTVICPEISEKGKGWKCKYLNRNFLEVFCPESQLKRQKQKAE